ncbi:DUF4156 domain-containing protein [Thiohalophilus sp.]|uniref:DUF4156 domain-containing protein n=1 Tax=Thiohalophilus sp. TaxID=3028392 RepID=UPI002ACE5A93|nr:DUF4156 domain-containing protein [Thiohalophilus sp.]MDZ7661398.1 DUF4156 domain-containing protein [Thiohalophilus sp.]
MKIIIVPFLMVALLLTGCITVSLSPEGSKVRLTSNPDVVRNCSYVGQVKGTDHFNGGLAGQGAAEENAMREIRNRAADMGANTVHIVTKSTGTSGSAIRGEAYGCT